MKTKQNTARKTRKQAEPETTVVDGTQADVEAITGTKVVEVGGLFHLYKARRHQDGSFVREGETLGAGTTAEEASDLLVATKPEALVKHKSKDIYIFGGDLEAVTHFHSQYGSKVGEMVTEVAPAPKAKKAKSGGRKQKATA